MVNDTFSKHHFHLQGKTAEAAINSLACKSFMAEWCHLNPKDTDGKEICDLLVYFDNILIIIQVKNITFKGNDERYIRKAYEDPIRQLKGAERKLRTLSMAIELENAFGFKVTYDPENIDAIYRLVFSVGDGEVPYNLMEEEDGRIYHCFDRTIEQILNELDTISDFCKYLHDKEKLAYSEHGTMIIAARELDMLADYLLNLKSFDHLKKFGVVHYDYGIWEDFCRLSTVKARKKANVISYFWDDLIDACHDCPNADYREVARELSRLDRFDRRICSDGFLGAHQIAVKRGRTQRRVQRHRGITYCFLCMPKDTIREQRVIRLGNFCFVARDVYAENPKVVGIATEIDMYGSHSYDFCLLDFPDWSRDNHTMAKDIQSKYEILVSPEETPYSIDEYPATADEQPKEYVEIGQQTMRRRFPKIGRNDPCPCGSGKKYKKCCGQK